MAITIRTLADGQLAGSKSVLYTCPALTTAIVRLITYVNTGADVTVNLYVKPSGGTSRRIIPKDMALLAGYLMEEDQIITLEAGDIIEGDASAATRVDYTIGGIERT